MCIIIQFVLKNFWELYFTFALWIEIFEIQQSNIQGVIVLEFILRKIFYIISKDFFIKYIKYYFIWFILYIYICFLKDFSWIYSKSFFKNSFKVHVFFLYEYYLCITQSHPKIQVLIYIFKKLFSYP